MNERRNRQLPKDDPHLRTTIRNVQPPLPKENPMKGVDDIIGTAISALGLKNPQSGSSSNAVTVVFELGPETLERLDRIAKAIETTRNQISSKFVPEADQSGDASVTPEYLSKEDAAQFLGVPVKTITYLLTCRKLRFVQIGSQRGRVIPVEELRKFAQQKIVPTAEEMLAKKRRN
jgi:excisionase family DNA binding protein